MSQPRGIRNNNPGNIDYHAANKWKGQVGIETDLPNGIKPRFAKFESMEYGIRAICELLQTYARKYKADTIREVISRYAPAHENKTDRYIENVCKWSGFKPDQEFDPNDRDTLKALIPAIIRQECAVTLDSKVVLKGIDLSL